MDRSDQNTKAFAAKPIRQRRTFEEVIVQLRQAIVERRLKVGDRLPQERELAATFGISRQSLREGLRMLEAFGMLSARRGVGPESGWTVSADGSTGLSVLLDLYTSLQRTPLWDLLEIREALEAQSARSAAERATADAAASLVAAARQMASITDRAQFLKVDTAFHVAIAQSSGNTLAPLFMEAIRDAIARVMLVAFEESADWPAERELLVREHIEIATLIASGKGAAAAKVLNQHISGFYGRALKSEAHEPDGSEAVAVPT
jgi:GntR family transcriptional repressor for pyruvate dehydrogenase complex